MRMVDQGVTKLMWVPGDTTIANVHAPTAAQINTTGTDVTCIMVSTYEVMPDASDTTNERAVCETANNVTPTIQNYKGNLVFFRQIDSVTGVPQTNDPLNIFAYAALGWFVRRIGKPYTTAFAAGDICEVYKFMSDTPQPNGGSGDGFLKSTVPLLPQGSFDIKAVVA